MTEKRLRALEILRECVNDSAAGFRPGQWQAIDALVNRREKRIVIEKTGWGKSYVYFIATKLLREDNCGPTIIVSPLLALMRNQLDAAHRAGLQSVTINSNNRELWPELESRVLNCEIDLVLISPERLANERFVTDILLPVTSRLGMFVVDEAHCISDWGHDFRPDYRRIVNILREIPPKVPVLGTTATANNRVISDIQNQLGELTIQRGPLIRKSIHLQTLNLPDQQQRLAWLAQYVPQLPGSGIIYVLTKKDADRVADWLTINQISAHAYYNNVIHQDFDSSNESRVFLEDQFLRNKLKVLVATTALGMGFDKPDIGFVIHFQSPGSVIAYYQQVGRAGRGLDKAFGILMTGNEDSDIQAYFRKSAFPALEHVREILSCLEDNEGMRLCDIEKAVNVPHGKVKAALAYLAVESPSPVYKEKSKYYRTAVKWSLDTAKIHRLTEQRVFEWQEIQRYAKESGCLMRFLADSLDDSSKDRCGHCVNCQGTLLIPADIDHDLLMQATRFIKQSEIYMSPRIRIPPNAFPVYGFSGNLREELRAEEGRILSRWGDAGWGQMVSKGKHNKQFSDDLVGAVKEMITNRWKPEPFPEWITCVSSLNNINLVPDFAQRLSAELHVPFFAVVKKIKENEPQKNQLNSFHQCHNLDGVFQVEHPILSTPVLLIDDVVDSQWTLTVVSALLRQAGSGPVFPVALATAEPGGVIHGKQ